MVHGEPATKPVEAVQLLELQSVCSIITVCLQMTQHVLLGLHSHCKGPAMCSLANSLFGR